MENIIYNELEIRGYSVDVGLRWFDEQGVLNISIQDFLLDDSVV